MSWNRKPNCPDMILSCIKIMDRCLYSQRLARHLDITTCMACNAQNIPLFIDKIDPHKRLERKAIDLINIQILCSECLQKKAKGLIVDVRSDEYVEILLNKLNG